MKRQRLSMKLIREYNEDYRADVKSATTKEIYDFLRFVEKILKKENKPPKKEIL